MPGPIYVLYSGTSGPDILTGAATNDIIRGLAGNDTLNGKGNDDRLEGGNGNDTLKGGKGKDVLIGANGSDRLEGGKGNDIFKLSQGGDILRGGLGRDTLDASDFDSGVVVNATALDQGYPVIAAGTITLANGKVQTLTSIENFLGSRFDNTFYGEAATATLRGGNGADHLDSTGAKVKVFGGNGDDILRAEGTGSKVVGGQGNDRISVFGQGMAATGGAGDDIFQFSYKGGNKVTGPQTVIRGGAGNDTFIWSESDTYRDLYPEIFKVFGGAGADTFDFGFYQSGTVQDFETGTDKVDLTVHLSKETTSFAELQTMISDTMNGAVLKLDFSSISGFEFVFKGVLAADFVDGDFIF